MTWGLGGGGWLVLALVNAGLAEQKNRPRLSWFVVSLFLGPLATFLIVTWAAPTTPPPPPLHPIRNPTDRYLVLAFVFFAVFLGAAVVVAIGHDWIVAAVAVVALGLLIWAATAYRRAWLRDFRAERAESELTMP